MDATTKVIRSRLPADFDRRNQHTWPRIWLLPDDTADVVAATVDQNVLDDTVKALAGAEWRLEMVESISAGLISAYLRLMWQLRAPGQSVDQTLAFIEEGARGMLEQLERVEAAGWPYANPDDVGGRA